MTRALAIATLVCAQLATARADDNKARADALYEQAGTHFKAGRYQDAIKAFQEAYALVADPVYLFNLAQAYRKVLDCVAASEHYRRYLDADSRADAQTRASVEQWIAELAPCVDQRKKEMETTRRLEEADKKRKAEEAARRQHVASTDRGRSTRRIGLVVAGGGAGLIVAGGLFALRAQRLSNELATDCPGGGCDWTKTFEDKERAAERSDVFAIVGVAAGSAAVITGVLVYLRGRSTKTERVIVTPTRTGAAVSIRF